MFRVLVLFLMLSSGSASVLSQTINQVVIGPTSGVGSWAYGPIYRNTGNAGVLNYSRYAYLYTAAELGIPSGSKIVKLEWLKKDTSQIIGNNNYSIWLSNSSATTLPTTAVWSTLVTGATQVFSSTTFSVTGGANTYISAPLSDTLIYNGQSLQILTDWAKLGYATAGVQYYVVGATAKAIGIPSNVALTSTAVLQTANYGGFRPTLRISYIVVPPCTGTPTPGNTLASVSSICSGSSFSLSLQNATTGNQVTYQWQSASNATFTSGLVNLGTSSGQTVNQTTATYYRCKVSCGATGTFAYSNTLFMPMAPSYACYCASAAQSDADEDIVKFTLGSMRNCSNCSSVAPGLGSVQNIYSNYQSVSPAIVQKGSLVPFVIDVGICGSNVYPNRCAIFIDFNQNNSFADAGELVYSSSSGTSGPHSESGTILIPATALTGLTGVRVINSEQGTAISDPCLSYPWGETEDYLVNILPAAACSGTPVPGNSVVEVSGSCTPVSGTYEVCSGKTLTLTISNLVAGTGFQYQWYENGFPISGATNGAYTTNAVTSAKVYYCRVTCINSGLSANSTPVNITLSSFLNCYCTSAATQVADQEILSFTLNGASTVSDCVTPAGGSGSLLNRYANYTNLGSITNLTIGGSTSFSAFVDDCDIPPPPYYSFGTAIWIDLNHNGSFNDAGEQLFVEGVPVAGPRTVSGTLSIPCTALPGLTRLRILIAEGFSGATLTPCMAYGFGETEDYLVNLTSTATTCTLPIPSPGNTLSTVNTFCDSTTATLSISNNCISSGYSFQWYKNGVAVTGATSRNYTTPMQYATSSWYCKVSCGSNFLNSTTITITKSNSTVGVTPTSSTYCPSSGIPSVLTASGANQYAWSPGTGLNSTSAAIVNATPAATTTYTVSGLDANGCLRTATTVVQVVSCSGTFTIKAYLQGYYQLTGAMAPAAYNQGVSSDPNFTDSVFIDLHQSTAPYTLIASKKAAMNINGIATASFASSLSGTYYIGIRHRNTIESWSSVPVSLSSGSYDFTTAANKAFGSNQILVDTGKWALYSGDLNTDDNVDLLDMSLQEVDINNFGFGYLVTDINGDGNVDLIDTMVMESNISDFIFSIHP